MPSEYKYKLGDYSHEVIDCVDAPAHHLHNFLWVDEEPTKVLTCEVEPKESKAPLANVITTGLPLYQKIVHVINCELKSAGFTGKYGNRTYNIAKQLLDDATAEVLSLLSADANDETIRTETRRVIRKHIARYEKRSSQVVSPEGMGESTNGDDAGDGCSIGNGSILGSSLKDTDDFALSRTRFHTTNEPMFGPPRLWTMRDGNLIPVEFDESQLSPESRRRYHQRYKTTTRTTASGRCDFRKVRALEDRLIDQIDRKHTRVKAAVVAVGLRDWNWLVGTLTRCHLTGAERVRACRIRKKLASLVTNGLPQRGK